ncbi:condensin complex protein MksE [Sorangium sp. So ce1182]|uniref:condensin complex protein MksE n=1 Tax=Sorangium sp. So ce1182 TaxID=3133334 RepID=UPI003F5DD78D
MSDSRPSTTGENRFALPQLKDVFRQLSRGRHICREDGDPYWALRDRTAEFTDLFEQLGFQLRHHARDFFYFDGEDLSEAGERMTVFMFVLVEHIGDQGTTIEEGLMQRDWSISHLPHLTSDRYRELMTRVGVPDEKGLRGVVMSLDRLGFVEQLGGDAFRFRRPTYRFLDLCVEIARSSEREGHR